MRLKGLIGSLAVAGAFAGGDEAAFGVLSYPEPASISDTASSGLPAIWKVTAETAPDGTGVVAWEEGLFGGPIPVDGEVKARRISPDGTLSAIRRVSPAGESATKPSIVVDSSGITTFAWVHDDGGAGEPVVMYRRLLADNTFDGPAAPLSNPAEVAGSVAVAIDDDDRATVAWDADEDVRAVRLSAGGTPGTVVNVAADADDEERPVVAVDSQDRAMVVWTRNDTDEEVVARRINANGSLEAEHQISESGQDGSEYALAFDPGDRATVAWSGAPTGGGAGTYRIYARTLDAAGTLGSVEPLGPLTFEPHGTRVLMDSAGRAIVGWWAYLSVDNQDVAMRTRRLDLAGQPLGSGPANLGVGRSAAFAIDAQDRVTVAYTYDAGSTDRVSTVRISAGAVPGPVKTVADTNQVFFPALALDSTGRPLVAYAAVEGAYDVHAARGTLSPPQTSITSGPADGVTVSDDTQAFSFSSDAEVDGSFECRIDGAAFSACVSPFTTSPLGHGPHTFEVRGLDEDGTDPTPATRSFTVDRRVDGLRVKAKGKQRQRGKHVQIKVKVKAAEDAEAELRGKLAVGRRKGMPLRKAGKAVTAGKSRTVKLKLKKRGDERRTLRELKHGGSGQAKLTVVVTDELGNSEREKLKVKLKG